MHILGELCYKTAILILLDKFSFIFLCLFQKWIFLNIFCSIYGVTLGHLSDLSKTLFVLVDHFSQCKISWSDKYINADDSTPHNKNKEFQKSL